MPILTNFTTCGISSMNVNTTFSGSGLNEFDSLINTMIYDEFKSFLCIDLANYFYVNVTDTLVYMIDPLLTKIASNQPSIVKDYGVHYVHWDDSDSLISKVRSIISHIQDTMDLKDFLKCLSTSNQMKMNHIMNYIKSNIYYLLSIDQKNSNSNNMNNDMDFEIHFNNRMNEEILLLTIPNTPNGYNTSFTITDINIRGLNTINEFKLLDPSKDSNYTLQTIIGFDELIFKIDLSVNSIPTNSSYNTYKERLEWTLGM